MYNDTIYHLVIHLFLIKVQRDIDGKAKCQIQDSTYL